MESPQGLRLQRILSLPGVFSSGLKSYFLLGEHILPFLALRYPKLQDLLVVKFPEGCCGGYFDAHQVGPLGLLTYAFSVWILYILLLILSKTVLAPNLFSKSLLMRGTGHSGIYQKRENNNRLDSMSKRDANHPTFGCPSTCHIINTIGERATW